MRDFARSRAGDRCEYCRLRQVHSPLSHHIEHIVAKQHGGGTDPSNLALACHRCNLHKGPNLSGVDPLTGTVELLFHPRRDCWSDHFYFAGAKIEAKSRTGWVTILVLAMNDTRRLELRGELLLRGELG